MQSGTQHPSIRLMSTTSICCITPSLGQVLSGAPGHDASALPGSALQDGLQPACQHGPDECRLNRVINCAQRLRPAQAQWLPFVTCLAGRPRRKVLASVEKCAAGSAIEAGALWRCVDGPDGDALEHKAAEATAALDPPHT